MFFLRTCDVTMNPTNIGITIPEQAKNKLAIEFKNEAYFGVRSRNRTLKLEMTG